MNHDFALGVEQAETAPESKSCRNERERDRDRDEYARCARDAQGLEIGQSGEGEAENRPGDRQTGSQDNFGDPAVRGVVSRFPILAGLTGLLIPPQKEYSVVGSSRDARRYQQINDEGSESDKLMMAEECDNSSG